MKKINIRKYAIFFVLIFVIILFTVLTPTFLRVSNAVNIIRQNASLAIVCVGMMFVMLTGGIDLSVGSQIGLSGILMSILMVQVGMPILPTCIIGIICTTAVGFINGVIVTKTHMAPLIATLGMMTSLNGLTYIVCNGIPVYGLSSSFAIVGQGNIGIFPISGIIMLVIVLFGAFFLSRTYIGRYFYALGSNEEAARLAGISTNNIKILAYTLCGFFTGIASIVMLSRVNSGQPTTGSDMEMDVITAVVLGGVSVSGGEGKMRGVIVGVLIMGILNNGLILVGLSEYYQQLIKGLVLIAAVAFDSISKLHANNEKVAA